MAESKSILGELRDKYESLMDRVANAAIKSGRQPQSIITVAVTKYASPEQVRGIIELGHVDLGESRAQQMAQRVPAMDEFFRRRFGLPPADAPVPGGKPKALVIDSEQPRLRWHMVGHLQRNKVKQIVPLVDLIHSVDSLRLAEELHSYGAKHDPTQSRKGKPDPDRYFTGPIPILMQVNTSGEESKFGLAPAAAIPLAEQIDTMVHLQLRGLMTMAPHSDDPEDARPTFARLRELFEDIRKEGIGGKSFNILSMGMSNDFEVAIEEGANVVRVGSVLFGDNEPEDHD